MFDTITIQRYQGSDTRLHGRFIAYAKQGDLSWCYTGLSRRGFKSAKLGRAALRHLYPEATIFLEGEAS